MIQALLPQPLLSLVITGLWLALAPAMSVGNVLLGACLGLAIPWITARFWPDRPRLARPLTGGALFLRVLADIVVANWRVARRVVGPLDRMHPAFVKVTLEIDDPFAVSVLASIVSLAPGTVSVDIDRERKVLLVHALDAVDPDVLAATIKARYEAPLKEIFQC